MSSKNSSSFIGRGDGTSLVSTALTAFANFSKALGPDRAGNLIGKTVDYSKIRLSKNEAFRNRLGSRLGEVGCFVEHILGMPQDIEGLVLGDEIYLVQTRPQCMHP